MGLAVGLALVVLLAAAMFYRRFSSTRDADPGFTREGVLLAAYDFTERNAGAPAARDFAARLLERLRALPGSKPRPSRRTCRSQSRLPLRSFTLKGATQRGGARSRATHVTPG